VLAVPDTVEDAVLDAEPEAVLLADEVAVDDFESETVDETVLLTVLVGVELSVPDTVELAVVLAVPDAVVDADELALLLSDVV
jgi:hypothetical protein